MGGEISFLHDTAGRVSFTCQRHIELNPVRTGIVKHPGEYRWSSYLVNNQGNSPDLLSPHSLYQALGRTASERQDAYRELFRYELEPGEIDGWLTLLFGEHPIGNSLSYNFHKHDS